ncbi:hypothetical protein L207DRAFT_132059 [Hyaloscypha variabilis F]|uniref:Uncharacterized protein n=1 Tax=Hyaloscypha variabilis (strain UAMH 11265 / GT02V1 / F) TaxID=1149755 RepID=A0A2J6R647_HYAVF|nr:hypothetical protein L207DRAFT_132059 [Hyaloscypha variabilis F]
MASDSAHAVATPPVSQSTNTIALVSLQDPMVSGREVRSSEICMSFYLSEYEKQNVASDRAHESPASQSANAITLNEAKPPQEALEEAISSGRVCTSPLCHVSYGMRYGSSAHSIDALSCPINSLDAHFR